LQEHPAAQARFVMRGFGRIPIRTDYQHVQNALNPPKKFMMRNQQGKAA